VSCEHQPNRAHVLRYTTRNAGLLLAISFLVATAIFGCSTQPVPQNQYISPAPSQTSSSVPGRGKLEVASWYGPGFRGHLTSDGEIYNPKELTAASKTLPIGTRVRVTNPGNGRSVVVRINDRGPYVRGRNLDLSRSAARRIGMIGKGVCRVRVTRVAATSNHKPAVRNSRTITRRQISRRTDDSFVVGSGERP
jgi:rare lipoprotein A (peptidoglycan hydrolase)